MLRRLLLTTCVALVIGTGTARAGLLYDLLHPLVSSHKKTGTHRTSERAGEIVWSGLIMAENVEKPEPVPPELATIEQTLKELFGYNQFQIIGQHRTALRKGTENWETASKHFKLHVDAKEPSDDGYLVNLRLVQHDDAPTPNDQVVLETDTKLSKQSPLVIRGPQVGNGQLLLVLVVQ